VEKQKVQDAVIEAHRFIRKTEEALKNWSDYGGVGKFNGAAKRASLDLTRALAAMRKP
jgi:hypothetical protein